MDSEEVKKIYNYQNYPNHQYGYELNRWHKTKIAQAGYDMTLKSINYHFLSGFLSGNYLELGPGAGTWTKVILEKNPELILDLIDISSVMLKQAQENFKDYHNVNYIEGDFLEYKIQRQYDLFFSGRAFEYLSDKAAAIEKISGLLKPNGRGFIITKTPKYFINKLLGRRISQLHRGQIKPKLLISLLWNNNFKNIRVYPVTMSFPLLKSLCLNRLLHKIFFKFPLNFISQFFSESYCVKFTKQ